jgi:hypothetical protein
VPAKSIIDIDVNDQSFRQFNALFQRYQQQLRSTPLAWQNIARAQQQGVKGFRDLVLQQAAAIGQTRLLNEAHKAALNLLRQEESSWQRIRRETTGAATNIRDMTASLLKWTSLTAVFSGLLGAGGLFGISRLAEGVASGRRSSLGLGTTYGGQRAFNTAFSRFADTGALLSGVESARTNASGRVALYGAGLSDRDLTGDTAAVAARALAGARRLAQNTPDQFLGDVFRSRHLGDLGLSEDDFRRLKRTSAAEFAQQQGAFGRYSASYGVGLKEQQDYQNFVTALSDASNRIENVFVRGLAPLIPGMEKLSNSIVSTIENLAKAVPKDVMDRIGKGIEAFGQYLGSEDFQNDVKAFAGGVAWIAGKIRDLGVWAAGRPAQVAVGTASAVYNSGSVYDPKTAASSDAAHKAAGDAFSPFFGWYKPALSVKPGSGTLTPELTSIAKTLQGKIGSDFDRITAGDDAYHRSLGRPSAHTEGRAFDFTIKNPARSEEIADLVRKELAKEGIKGRVINEYLNPSSGATGGHIHVQTDVRVMNAAGSNVIVQAKQVTPSP